MSDARCEEDVDQMHETRQSRTAAQVDSATVELNRDTRDSVGYDAEIG